MRKQAVFAKRIQELLLIAESLEKNGFDAEFLRKLVENLRGKSFKNKNDE